MSLFKRDCLLQVKRMLLTWSSGHPFVDCAAQLMQLTAAAAAAAVAEARLLQLIRMPYGGASDGRPVWRQGPRV